MSIALTSSSVTARSGFGSGTPIIGSSSSSGEDGSLQYQIEINDRVNRTASHVHREKKYNSLLNTHGKIAKKAQQNGPPKY